jgi:hypothetical protein
MPRNVRNFWLDGWVDGRTTGLAAGPRSAQGGFTLRVSIRDGGAVRPDVVRVVGAVDPDGKLYVRVYDEGGDVVHEVATAR